MSPRKLPYLLLLTTDPQWFSPSQSQTVKRPKTMKTQLSVYLYLVSFLLSQNAVEGKIKKKIKILLNLNF